MAIVALRFVVGAHFFHEGYTKWRDSKPFSAPVFSAAKGPLASFYHGLVWDKDGLHRLNKDETYRIWGIGFPEGEKSDPKQEKPDFSGGYLAEAYRHFGFNQDQHNEAAEIVLYRRNQYRAVLEQWESDIAEYRAGLERKANYAQDPTRQLSSLRKHDDRINTELNGKRMPWQTEIDKVWLGLEKDMNALADREGLAGRGYLKLIDRPGSHGLDSRTMDRFVPYFDMTIGVLLVLGLFTRVAASIGGAFLATIVASQWPFASDAMATGNQQVEMCAMLVLATIGAGKYAGLDSLLGNCCSWCCTNRKTASATATNDTNTTTKR